MQRCFIVGILAFNFFLPVPKQAQDPNGQAPKATPIDQAAPSRSMLQNEGNRADGQTHEPSWREKLLKPLLDNWPVLLVAIWGIIVAIRTVQAIENQAGLMKGQLQEMQDAGVQTEKQGRHIVNAERAWIQVKEIILLQKLSFVVPILHRVVWLHPYIVNNGRTHARLTRVIARADILEKIVGSDSPRPPVLPEQPQFRPEDTLIERNIILSPKQGINWINVPISGDDLERITKRQAFLYVYGRIDYTDISEKERHTGFCQLYWIPYSSSDPVPEDFIDSALIPPAYTEST
jgi:hypothetical protein